jgi:hypothetical protein
MKTCQLTNGSLSGSRKACHGDGFSWFLVEWSAASWTPLSFWLHLWRYVRSSHGATHCGRRVGVLSH